MPGLFTCFTIVSYFWNIMNQHDEVFKLKYAEVTNGKCISSKNHNFTFILQPQRKREKRSHNLKTKQQVGLCVS